jgi:hypothetical protein
MSKNNHDPESKELAFKAYNLFDAFLMSLVAEDDISIDVKIEATRDAISQHFAHLENCKVKADQLDPYKMVCWLTCSLLSKLSSDDSRILDAVATAGILTQNKLLSMEPDSRFALDANSMRFLKLLLINEKRGNSSHGIWQNGFYAAYHSAVFMKRRLAIADLK